MGQARVSYREARIECCAISWILVVCRTDELYTMTLYKQMEMPTMYIQAYVVAPSDAIITRAIDNSGSHHSELNIAHR